jgi:hypothetical protein
MPSGTNSSNEYWSANGVSLNQYAWMVSSWGPGRDFPPLRGNDVQFAYRPGKMFKPKYPDSRVVTLPMVVLGVDPATGQPDATDQIQRLNTNWRALRSALWTPYNQIPLLRQWKQYDPLTGFSEIISATATAQIAGTAPLTMTGRSRGETSIDFLLSDPFFYGPSLASYVINNNSTVIYNPGDDISAFTGFYIELNGPLSNPILTNTTANPQVSFQLNMTIGAFDSVILDVGNYIATRSSDLVNVVGTISHSGARPWMVFKPGGNVITLSSSSPSMGNAIMSFQPSYV